MASIMPYYNDLAIIVMPWASAGTKYRGDEFSLEALKEKPRPVAMVVMVVKGKLLWPMSFIFGMVQVQNNHGGNFGITADELIHQNLSPSIKVL